MSAFSGDKLTDNSADEISLKHASLAVLFSCKDVLIH